MTSMKAKLLLATTTVALLAGVATASAQTASAIQSKDYRASQGQNPHHYRGGHYWNGYRYYSGYPYYSTYAWAPYPYYRSGWYWGW